MDRRPYKNKAQKPIAKKKKGRKPMSAKKQQEEPNPPSTEPHSAIPPFDYSDANQGEQLQGDVKTEVNPNTDPKEDVGSNKPAGWPVLEQKPADK